MPFNNRNYSGNAPNHIRQDYTKNMVLPGCDASLLENLLNATNSLSSLSSMLDCGKTPSLPSNTDGIVSKLLSSTDNEDATEGYEIYISNLSRDITENELMNVFQPFGEMINCSIKANFGKVPPKHNVAHCKYAKYKDAQKAINQMDRKKVGKDIIKVVWSNRKTAQNNDLPNNDLDFVSAIREKLERALSEQAASHSTDEADVPEVAKKRNKTDQPMITENPLFQSPKEVNFDDQIAEGLLKISEFQKDQSKESSANLNKTLSLPTTPKSTGQIQLGDTLNDIELKSNASEEGAVHDNSLVMKDLEELKCKVQKLENEKINDSEKNAEKMNELQQQVNEEHKNNEELKKKIETLEQQPERAITPSMEDFENLRKKVESLEKEMSSKKIEQTKEVDENISKADPKEKEEEKSLSDIDVCILNLSQTINAYFKKLAGGLMSGQKEKDEELMMERLRSLEPVQTVIYEKLRWILSMGGTPIAEHALKSASKVSKHFPFLLAFLGFNYHDLIMMSIGMEGEISQAGGAIRLAKWFSSVLIEKTDGDKRIWPSSVSTTMLASILTEHFSASRVQKSGPKTAISNWPKPTANPMFISNENSVTQKLISTPKQDEEISIVDEVSQNKMNAGSSRFPANFDENVRAQNVSVPSLMDMRTLGLFQQAVNRPVDHRLSGRLPNNTGVNGRKRSLF